MESLLIWFFLPEVSSVEFESFFVRVCTLLKSDRQSGARGSVRILAHCASLVGRQPPISYIYRGGVTTLRTREWSLISSPSRHGVHRMHGLDGATGYRIERCRLCACTAQPLLRPKQLPGPPLACWTLTPFFQAVFATLSMMAAAITVRIHWRCAHVVQMCLGDHHRLLESSPPAHVDACDEDAGPCRHPRRSGSCRDEAAAAAATPA